MKEMIRTIGLSLVCSAVTSAVLVTSITAIHRRDVATVKIDSILADHMREYGAKAKNDEERKVISERFAEAISRAIQDVSAEQKIVLLVSPAVVSNVPDYTEEIRSRINSSMEAKQR